MTDSTWPNEPYRRKAVFVLNQTDIDALRLEEGGAELLLNQETYILPYPPQQSSTVVQNLIDRGLARPGAVLIQSPFNKDNYEESMQAVERFALDKHMLFSELCMHLGAREVTVEQIDLKNTMGKTTVSVESSLFMRGSGNVKIENEELDSLQSKLTLHDTFPGGSPDAPQARDLLKRTGLLDDVNMRSLLDMRQNSSNPLTTRLLRLNMTSEAQRNLNVLVNLNVPPFLSLEADYDRHVREQTEFTLAIKVDF